VSDPEDGKLDVLWSTDDHTGNMVPIYSAGTYANRFVGTLDNAQVGQYLFHYFIYSQNRTTYPMILKALYGLVYDDRTRIVPNSMIFAISN